MGGPRPLLQLVGSLGKLLGLHYQQVRAGIDADVLELCCLLPQVLDLPPLVLEPPVASRIAFLQRLARRLYQFLLTRTGVPSLASRST